MHRGALSRTNDLDDQLSILGGDALPVQLLNASTLAMTLQVQLPALSSNLRSVRSLLDGAVTALGGSLNFTSDIGAAVSVGSTLVSVKVSIARALDATAALPDQPLALGGAKSAWGAVGGGDATAKVTQLQVVLRSISALAADATGQGQTLTPADWQVALRQSLPRLAALLGTASSLRGSLITPVTSAVTAAVSLGPYAARVLAVGCGSQLSDGVQAADAAQGVFAAAAAAQSRLALLRSGLSALSPLIGPLTTAASSANSTSRSLGPLITTFSATWAAITADSISILRDAATSLKELVAHAVDSFDSKVTGLMVQASQAVAT